MIIQAVTLYSSCSLFFIICFYVGVVFTRGGFIITKSCKQLNYLARKRGRTTEHDAQCSKNGKKWKKICVSFEVSWKDKIFLNQCLLNFFLHSVCCFKLFWGHFFWQTLKKNEDSISSAIFSQYPPFLDLKALCLGRYLKNTLASWWSLL